MSARYIFITVGLLGSLLVGPAESAAGRDAADRSRGADRNLERNDIRQKRLLRQQQETIQSPALLPAEDQPPRKKRRKK